MTIKLLKDLDFASKLSVAEPVTEAAQNVVKNYRGFLFVNSANCAVVNNFIREAQQYAYDKGMSKILEGVVSFINENRISWALATACENIAANNSTYSYIAKLGISKVEKLLEMNEADVVSYIKAGALKGVKYIPEFREICKEVYKTTVNETAQTINYEMHTPFCYSIVAENGDTIVMLGGKTYAINENEVRPVEYVNDALFNKMNAHLSAFTMVGEAITYKFGNVVFTINEDKLTMTNNGNEVGVFENTSEFIKYCDMLSRTMPNQRQFMTIAGAVSEVFEHADGITCVDIAREFNCTNGTKALVIEGKDNVISVANGVVKNAKFMIEALENIEQNCGTDVKVVYESRINEDVKLGNPEQYKAIQEELQRTQDAQAEIRYRKIEQLAESLKNNPAAIAVLNTLTKELRMLEEKSSTLETMVNEVKKTKMKMPLGRYLRQRFEIDDVKELTGDMLGDIDFGYEACEKKFGGNYDKFADFLIKNANENVNIEYKETPNDYEVRFTVAGVTILDAVTEIKVLAESAVNEANATKIKMTLGKYLCQRFELDDINDLDGDMIDAIDFGYEARDEKFGGDANKFAEFLIKNADQTINVQYKKTPNDYDVRFTVAGVTIFDAVTEIKILGA